MKEIPTIKEELDRKTFETFEWLVLRLNSGVITPAQFEVGIDTLFMAVSGLVRNDFIDMITMAQSMCEKKS